MQIPAARPDVVDPKTVHVKGPEVEVTLTLPLAFAVTAGELARAVVGALLASPDEKFACGPTPVPCK